LESSQNKEVFFLFITTVLVLILKLNFSYYLFTALKHLEMYTKDLI